MSCWRTHAAAGCRRCTCCCAAARHRPSRSRRPAGARRRAVHWRNAGYADFEQFLARLAQPKRKKIRAERRKVAEAGVLLERKVGRDITRPTGASSSAAIAPPTARTYRRRT